MMLPCQRQGFIVDGHELPLNHPQHPANKGNLGKQVKSMMKNKLKLKRKHGRMSDAVLPNTVNMNPRQPAGSYAL